MKLIKDVIKIDRKFYMKILCIFFEVKYYVKNKWLWKLKKEEIENYSKYKIEIII